MNVNCLSHIALIKAFKPNLARGAGGSIVNVSSIAGLLGVSVRTGYSASKFGIIGFSKAIRAELAKDNIKVLCVYPGFVQTNISKAACSGVFGQ